MKIRHGIDIIRISRIERSVLRSGQAFLDRIWTGGEQAYCMKREGQSRYQSLAARFAAKEAVAKALGTGLLRNGIALTSIEVYIDALGSPSLALYGGAKRRYEALGGIDIAISLTHDGDLAQASCVMLCNPIHESVRTAEVSDGEK